MSGQTFQREIEVILRDGGDERHKSLEVPISSIAKGIEYAGSARTITVSLVSYSLGDQTPANLRIKPAAIRCQLRGGRHVAQHSEEILFGLLPGVSTDRFVVGDSDSSGGVTTATGTYVTLPQSLVFTLVSPRVCYPIRVARWEIVGVQRDGSDSTPAVSFLDNKDIDIAVTSDGDIYSKLGWLNNLFATGSEWKLLKKSDDFYIASDDSYTDSFGGLAASGGKFVRKFTARRSADGSNSGLFAGVSTIDTIGPSSPQLCEAELVNSHSGNIFLGLFSVTID